MAEKNYFTIREIAKKTQLPEYTIRYWESKFKLLRPLRLSSGHRRYTVGDVELINEIRSLMSKGYTLAGAKKAIFSKKKNAQPPAPAAFPPDDTIRLLEDIRKELQQLIRDC